MSETPIDGLKALAHPLRYRILAALGEGERNVGEIEEACEIGQPALSQQLAVLRQAGLVRHRRDARLVYYSIDARALTALCDAIAALLPPAPDRSPAARTAESSLHGAAQFARLE